MYKAVCVISHLVSLDKVKVAEIIDFEVLESSQIVVKVGVLQTVGLRNDRHLNFTLDSIAIAGKPAIGFCSSKNGRLDEVARVPVCGLIRVRDQQVELSNRKQFEVLNRLIEHFKSRGKLLCLMQNELKYAETTV